MRIQQHPYQENKGLNQAPAVPCGRFPLRLIPRTDLATHRARRCRNHALTDETTRVSGRAATKKPRIRGVDMVGLRGLEPLTSRLSVVRSSQLSYRPMLFKMAELTGFEPAFSCVTGRHVRPLHHSSMFSSFGCGGRTRTCDLRVMSPTSCQLLHPATFGGGGS
jgi:hypothetical protein